MRYIRKEEDLRQIIKDIEKLTNEIKKEVSTSDISKARFSLMALREKCKYTSKCVSNWRERKVKDDEYGKLINEILECDEEMVNTFKEYLETAMIMDYKRTNAIMAKLKALDFERYSEYYRTKKAIALIQNNDVKELVQDTTTNDEGIFIVHS